jgi:ribosomal protein L31E
MLLLLTQIVFFGDTYVSSTQLNKPIWNKGRLSPPGKYHVAVSIDFKN